MRTLHIAECSCLSVFLDAPERRLRRAPEATVRPPTRRDGVGRARRGRGGRGVPRVDRGGRTAGRRRLQSEGAAGRGREDQREGGEGGARCS